MQISPNTQIDNCPNFFWHEALFLASWHVTVFPENFKIKENIEKTARKMQQVRAILDKPCKVTSWYRPPHYNIAIGGQAAKRSWHILGLACDFIPINMDIKYAKSLLVPRLGELDIRMHNNGNDSFIHIDLGDVGPSGRYFK